MSADTQPSHSSLQRALGVLALGVGALLAVWLHFRPAWAELAPEGAGSAAAFRSVFFETSNPEPLFGHTVDLIGTLWTFDNLVGLLDGRLQVLDATVFAPVGLDLGAAQGFAWLDALLALPLLSAFGSVGFYNPYVALLIAANVVAVGLLLRRTGAAMPVVAALAVLVCTCPFARSELISGRSTQAHWVFHALFLLFVLRLQTAQGRRALLEGALAGICLAGACFVYWFSAIAVALAAGVVLLVALIFGEGSRRWLLAGCSALGLTTLALTLPPTWRLSAQALLGGTGAGWFDPGTPQEVSVLGLFDLTTHAFGGLEPDGWSALAEALANRSLPSLLVVLGLVALCLPQGWRRALPWGLAWLLLLPLPLGASLLWGEELYALPLALVEQGLGILGRLSQPERLVVGPLLAAAVGVALAAGSLLRDRPAWLAWTTGGVLLVGGLALQPDQGFGKHAYSVQPEPIYLEAARRWPGGIIDVPLVITNTRYVEQLFHDRAVLGGPGIDGTRTRPAAHDRYCADNSFLDWLERAAEKDGVAPDFDPMDLQRLVADGFGIVVIHQRAVATPAWKITAAVGTPFLRSRDSVAFPLVAPDRMPGDPAPLRLGAEAPWSLDQRAASRTAQDASWAAGWLRRDGAARLGKATRKDRDPPEQHRPPPRRREPPPEGGREPPPEGGREPPPDGPPPRGAPEEPPPEARPPRGAPGQPPPMRRSERGL